MKKRATKRYVRKGIRRVRKTVPVIHKFKEMYKPTAPVGAGAAAFQGGVLPVLGISELTNVTSFQTMFDLYKIVGVKYQFIPRFNQADVNSLNSIPLMYVATNRDPYVPAPVTVGDILNDDTCRIHRLDKPFSWYVKAPKPDLSVVVPNPEAPPTVAPYGFQFGPSTKFQPWLTTGGNAQTLNQWNIAHYGIRWAIDNQNSSPVSIDVYATLYFHCKEQD